MRIWHGPPFRLFSVTEAAGNRRQFTNQKNARALAREVAKETGQRLADVLRPSLNFYVMEYTDRRPRGRRVCTKCSTKFEVEEWKRTRIRDGRPYRSSNARRSVQDAVDDWLTDLEIQRRSAKTLRDYRSQSRFWVRHFGSETPVAALDERTVVEFFAAREAGRLGDPEKPKHGKPRSAERNGEESETEEPQNEEPKRKPSARTLNLNRTLLGMFFKWCRKRRLIQEDPLEHVDRWREPQREPRVLTPDEVAELLRACRDPYGLVIRREEFREYEHDREFIPPPWLYPLVLAGLCTLLRLRNLATLMWKQIDFKSGTISVPAEETKGRTDLLIPIPERLQECLRELGPGEPDDPVFACDFQSVRRPFQNAVRRAGITGRVTFHTLRKTGADWLRQKGVTLEATQKYGGWKDVEVLLRHYRNPSASELRAAAGHLDDLVGTRNG